ncbi:MAG TPA: hypothetical protein PK751_07005 [Verrucomicrobiota bacterium]|nr:hypothetical protein [Verrucomicrobiota bacterium]HQB72875.1 hypothetical protein [Verrucomicrobiota bacterium]
MDRKHVHWRQGGKMLFTTAIEGLYALKMAVHAWTANAGLHTPGGIQRDASECLTSPGRAV